MKGLGPSEQISGWFRWKARDRIRYRFSILSRQHNYALLCILNYMYSADTHTDEQSTICATSTGRAGSVLVTHLFHDSLTQCQLCDAVSGVPQLIFRIDV
jgi:hypothetical protein